MNPPYFSVVTPSWNQGAFLAGCLRSVVSQGDPDVEHLVFDNNSTDNSAAVAAGFPGVRFVVEADRGQSDAVNKGLRAARGEIICWLNTDDEYEPGCFAALREVFRDPSVNVVYGHVRQVSYQGEAEVIARARFDDRLDLIRWWSRRVKLHQPAVFFRRSLVEWIGLLREDLNYAMDYEYWWRMSGVFPFRPLDRVLAVQHRQPDSKTMKAWEKVLRERERIFAPHYGLVDGGRRRDLMREKRRELSAALLDQAYGLCGSDSRAALRWMGRSLREDPVSFFSLRWAGLLRRIF